VPPSQARFSSHQLERPSLPTRSFFGWLGPRIASLFSEARALCLNVALALLKLKSRRSPATRLLSPSRRRGFQEVLRASLFSDALLLSPRTCGGAAGERARRRYHYSWLRSLYRLGRVPTFVGTTGPSNKGMKLTKPSILELRSLSLVLDGPVAERRNGRGQPGVSTDQLPLPEQGTLDATGSPLVAEASSSSQNAAHELFLQLVVHAGFLGWPGPTPESRHASQRGASQ
jgi:hypothetical protein